ncbi:helix-turn-helix domain-containing protein [Rummeliibacillus stabekisii]|uniref:helix-turn-helix domain-containing protein n=1 Tax=Rummeliibacillus stabekisii TaxID=241244 RepID=UPI00116F3648|nr:helix-turn-helix domain-containing protein [Rummeliibacillus stabekisii]MBB5170754.1 YesN/AraC family two-component response regulator [Rummeliibacillus stabekisii]GEL06248.1 hypothetical protein RST01_28750 [Rummeliibacillus stabekisii]
MRIFIVDRDHSEAKGLEWYLKSYLFKNVDIYILEDIEQLLQLYKEIRPDFIIVEIELIKHQHEISFFKLARNEGIESFAIASEPLFQHALKAIQMQVTHFFIKPVDLDSLKHFILSVTKDQAKKASFTENEELTTDFYMELFLNSKFTYPMENQQFFLIEPEHQKDLIILYEWLKDSSIFEKIDIHPLSERIVCISGDVDTSQFEKKAISLIREWHMWSGNYINIAVYDGSPVQLNEAYIATKKTLNQRFYKGFENLFYVSKKHTPEPFDPILTPDEQQLWIQSLEDYDIHPIKEFLYRLSAQGSYFEEEPIRIHLTSVLAQIRRFMLKYHLHQNASLEENYRKLFHIILEYPILYTIIQEIILYTQTLMKHVAHAKVELKVNYAELAADIIKEQYKNKSLSLLETANELGITSNYLSSIFSKHHGIPFKRYLQHHRIQQAQKTLKETTLPISEVARLNGFDDPNYFTKTFKAYTSISPIRYRKKH